MKDSPSPCAWRSQETRRCSLPSAYLPAEEVTFRHSRQARRRPRHGWRCGTRVLLLTRLTAAPSLCAHWAQQPSRLLVSTKQTNTCMCGEPPSNKACDSAQRHQNMNSLCWVYFTYLMGLALYWLWEHGIDPNFHWPNKLPIGLTSPITNGQFVQLMACSYWPVGITQVLQWISTCQMDWSLWLRTKAVGVQWANYRLY